MKITTFIPTVALFLSPFALADHHGEKKASETPEASKKEADVKITIACNDQLQFDKKEFEVTTGQTVELTLENVGKLPKVAMGHNLVILAEGVQPATFALTAMKANATEYIPSDDASKKNIIAHTKLLGPSEKSIITFTAPAPGSYDYICTFPGHFGVMKGKMIVK